jgi:acyl carrier protein
LITIAELETLIRAELRGRQLKVGPLTELTLLSDLGLSSLQIADIVFTLEEEHEVEFDPAKAADARTLGDVMALGNATLAAAQHHSG